MRGDGITYRSGAYIVCVRRCLSRSPWLRKQRLERNLTVLVPAFGVLYCPEWGGDFLLN